MTKMIVVRQNGYTWHIPAEKIAESYATYYFNNHEECSYDDEYEYCIEDDYTTSDWFFNNMDLDDVVEYAVLVETPKPQDKILLDEDYEVEIENV